MARPLRIEYPGAWYHVMNRGRRAEEIFNDKRDYQMFVNLLKETSEMWNIWIVGYCLMPNHYHILIKTPDANISRSMRHLNGVYTQRFNSRHQYDGQLFRGRYKSILVSGDIYLLQLLRYIHRNPLKSGLVDNLKDYTWSSHKGYLSVAKKWDWLHKKYIFSMLTKQRKEWLKKYRQFMSVEEDDDTVKILESKKGPSFLGPKSFTDWVKGKYYDRKSREDIPQFKELAPERELIIRTVCKYYHVPEEDLLKTRRGLFNEPRNAAIFLLRKLRRDTLRQIGEEFQIKKYSSVSSAIERMKVRISKDRKMTKRLKELSQKFDKSQEQT